MKTEKEIIETAKANREAVAADSPIHAEVIDAFKEQLLIAFMNRLGGKVSIPVKEIDETGRYVMSFQIVDGNFNFTLAKKQ